MDLFKDEKILLKNGGFVSAFKWSLLAFVATLLPNYLGLMLLQYSFFAAIFLLAIISNVLLGVVSYLALKKGINRFKLNGYWLRANYLCSMLLLVLFYNLIVGSIMAGELSPPRVGLPPLIISLLLPYLVKK